jgi:hypothetical protein
VGAVLAFGPCLFRIVGEWQGWSFFVEPIQLFVLGVVGIGALWLGTRGKNIYVSPILFVILFLVSYPLRVISVEINPLVWSFGGVGQFPFTSDAYWTFVGIAVLGISGLTAGQFVVRLWLNHRRVILNMKVHSIRKDLPFAGWLWFCISIVMLILSGAIGIGSVGLTPVALPFRMTGLLYFLRALVLPLVGMYLFGVAVETNQRRQARMLLLMALLLGVLSFPITLSKAALLNALLPYAVYLSIYAYYHPLSRQLRRSILVAIILLLPVMVFGVLAARDVAYSTGRLAGASEIVEGFYSEVGSQSVYELAAILNSLILDRVTGGSELMGVVAAPLYSSELVLRCVLGQGTNPDLGFRYIFDDIYNVTLTEEGGVYQGKALGLFGLLYLSHNPFLLLLLALILGGLALWVEDLFLRETNAALAAGVGFMVSMAMWESVFDILLYYPVFLGSILIISRILSGKSLWRDPFGELSCHQGRG